MLPGTLVPSLRQRFHYVRGCKDDKLLSVLAHAHDDAWLRDGTALALALAATPASCPSSNPDQPLSEPGSALVFCKDPPTAERLADLIATSRPSSKVRIRIQTHHTSRSHAARSHQAQPAAPPLPSSNAELIA